MADPGAVPESVLVVAAHPDDIEFACAGTLALWARGGSRLRYVLCTSGAAGVDDPAISPERAVEIRESEQRAAAAVLGAEVEFLGEPDGLLQPTLELRRRLVREIRRFCPEVVVCGDPSLIWMGPSFLNHPDHRAAATAALEAAWPAAGQRNLYPEMDCEGLALHRPRRIYVSGWVVPGADCWVDIGETLEIKLQALRCHASQMAGSDPGPFIRNWAAGNAQGRGMDYAECFRVVTLVPDELWARTRGRRG
jgi:LmbE family N-acetylglucosaminyl deacetylase